MRHRPIASVFALLVWGLAACAPASTAPAPTAPRPVTVGDTAAAREPAEALDNAPDNWWLLDPQSDRIRGTGAERSYTELLAGQAPRRTVVVAIIDSGVDAEHEDLDDNLWVNEREIAGNNRDDDGNGYTDDRHGWNFLGGADGRNVRYDTYELTRIYAQLHRRFSGARPDTLRPAVRAEYDRYREIRREFEAERAEATEQLERIRAIDTALDHFLTVLRRAVGTDSLTVENVSALRALDPEVRQARQAYLQIAAAGVTPQDVKRQREYLEARVRYGLDPSFDPRPIVGDDPTNYAQRHYGNANVEGPHADHGTHVAGIVAAERGNGIGVNGIAPAVRVMSIRAVPDGDERDKDVANAIRYAVDNGAHIINMSFGKAYSPGKRAVDEAVKYADSKGVLMVHAAGNEANDLDAKPSFPNRNYLDGGAAQLWIEVGASSWQSVEALPAPFSNFGRETVDVFAPGVDILSTVPDNRYERNDGTSMAAPVVSGLAALLMAYFPELSAADVKRIILESATRYAEESVIRPGSEEERVPFGALSRTGGVVNAYAAIRMAQQMTGGNRR